MFALAETQAVPTFRFAAGGCRANLQVCGPAGLRCMVVLKRVAYRPGSWGIHTGMTTPTGHHHPAPAWNRRSFLTVLSGGLVATPLAAQTPAAPQISPTPTARD